MGGWETLHCANHPGRLALERCEVCGKPLCAYCLYYTADGQRLCAEHAEEARLRGVVVEDPAQYAGQLLGAQAGAARKRKSDDDGLYRGNSTDLLGLIALLIALFSLAACGGGIYCLPPIGFILSLLAVINAKNAHDPARTRRYGLIGMALSALWVLLLVACFVLFFVPFTTTRSVIVFPTPQPYVAPTSTPTPTPTPPPDLSPEDVIALYPAPR